jgi:hypothetical protein
MQEGGLNKPPPSVVTQCCLPYGLFPGAVSSQLCTKSSMLGRGPTHIMGISSSNPLEPGMGHVKGWEVGTEAKTKGTASKGI